MDGKPNNAKNYAELLEDMMSVMDYTIDKNENGEYQIFDQQTETYLINEQYNTDTFRTAEEITDRVSAAISEYVCESMQDAVEETLNQLDKDIPEDFPITAKELDNYIKSNPDVYQSLKEAGYDNDIEYLDLLANHLEEVNLEQLFSQKWIDDVSVDADADAVMYYAENGVLDVHLNVSDAIVSEMIRTSFDWGEQADDVSHGHVPDFKQAGIEYADLYVEFREIDLEKPVYTLSLQMSDDSKRYFSTELSGDMKDATPMVVTDDMKSSISSVLNEHFDSKIIDEVIVEKKNEDRDITD